MRKALFTGLLLSLSTFVFAQKPGWQHLDPQKDSIFGVSTNLAYSELLKGKKPKIVIVGIVDSGVDTLHEDLKSVIWTDPKTGHHGWNYIGPETGQEDITRLVGDKQALYDSLAYTTVPEQYRAGYQQHRKLSTALDDKIKAMEALVVELQNEERMVDKILKKIGKANPDTADFRHYKTTDEPEQSLANRIAKRLALYLNWESYRENEMDRVLAMAKYHLVHGLNVENNKADTAKGNFDIAPDKLGPVVDPNMTAYHGTHVAGIIGAVRNNAVGMDGVADDVQLLMLKENGTIREMRDEALARAIRFAVDHGAKVINLSFGKSYTWDKKKVDEAIRYAMKHDVLLVHAAGNSNENLDNEQHYPSPVFLDKTKADNWLEVGASTADGKAADFSNYGRTDVDVFAPGVQIYSTLPYNQYASWNGTSMATPVVSGIAALIREYYPKLTAVQVKEIIMRTVNKTEDLKDKCVSGGVVDAYKALKLAATYK